MLPRRQDEPFERAETEIVRGPEGTETLRIAVLRHQFDPRLRRNADHHPEGERDQQPRAPRLCDRPRPAELRHQSRTRLARDRTSVWLGKSVSLRAASGGPWIINKNNKT